MGTPAVIRSLRQARESQAGVAASVLLALAGLLVVMLVIGLAGTLTRQQEADRRTGEALAQAKTALIGYAVTYADRLPFQFGYLPCPDFTNSNNEGISDTGEFPCPNRDVTAIGRLPWRTLGLPPLKDSAGECLWYAVSGNFKANLHKSRLLNWDSNALIEVLAPDGTTRLAGSTPTNRAAAVIFSPGALLPGQDRISVTNTAVCGGNYTPSNYLDTDAGSGINNAAPSTIMNALSTAIAAFNSNQASNPNHNFNDRLVYITSDEIWREIAKRKDFIGRLSDPDPDIGVLGFIAKCLTTEKNPFPFAADLQISSPPYFYHADDNYSPQPGTLAGRLPDEFADCAGPNIVKQFLTNWKDHFFYAVADPYASPWLPGSTPLCDPSGSDCLTVDGTPGFAAVIVFAGERGDFDGYVQSRTTEADYSSLNKQDPRNYLEGVNLTRFQTGTGEFSRSAGNDILITVCWDDPTDEFKINQPCAVSPPTSLCTEDANALLLYRDLDDAWRNDCLNPLWWQGLVKPECRTIRDRIGANCTAACGDAAKDFVRWPCLYNLNDSRCDPIIDALENCS